MSKEDAYDAIAEAVATAVKHAIDEKGYKDGFFGAGGKSPMPFILVLCTGEKAVRMVSAFLARSIKDLDEKGVIESRIVVDGQEFDVVDNAQKLEDWFKREDEEDEV